MKSLMRPGTGDHIRDDPKRDEIIDLLELDLLLLQLLVDAPEAFDAAVDRDDRHLRVGELGRDRPAQLLNQPFRLPAFRVHVCTQRLVCLWFEIAEREFFELVLHFPHAQPVGDGCVDVARLLRDARSPVVRQMAERAHVVQAVRELHENHADVVHHREQHLAEILGLPLFARGEGDRADFRDTFDHVRHLGTEELLDSLDGGQRVLDNIVQQPGRDGDRVHFDVGQEVSDGERVDQVGLARMADLSPVLERREHVSAPEQFHVGVGAVGPDFFEQILEADHGNRCLNQ
jgi:hypothetical protein